MPSSAPPTSPPTTEPDAVPSGPRGGRLVPLLGALAFVQGCAAPPVDLARLADGAQRMTYEALRREDCRLNQLDAQPDAFCQRNFANEYVEYDRLRRRFIRESTETAWRASPTEEDR